MTILIDPKTKSLTHNSAKKKKTSNTPRTGIKPHELAKLLTPSNDTEKDFIMYPGKHNTTTTNNNNTNTITITNTDTSSFY